MFDVVKYTTLKLDREMMVPNHMDPGIFSFSVYSNAPGLEMYDQQTKKWFPVPLNMGVIWCGVAAKEASNEKLQAAYHRVQPHSKYERITFWYEVCVMNQLLTENLLPMEKKNNDDIISLGSNKTEYSDNAMIVDDDKSKIVSKLKNEKVYTKNVNRSVFSSILDQKQFFAIVWCISSQG